MIDNGPERRTFWSELKRRHVVKVAVVYVVVALAVVEAADLLFPRLQLPDAAVTLVVGLAILGLPIALVLAWAFELTPEGVRRDTGGGAAVDAAPRGAGEGAPESPAGSAGPATGAGRGSGRSVAVLAFADMSPEQDQGYFCDGISEEIIDGLTRVEGLEVAARTSTFMYKGKDVSVRQIGEELGVDVVLEGSVRKAGNSLRITAQLIEVSNGYHLWSERYDRELEEVFRIQEEIAEGVVGRLRESLGGRVGSPVLKTHTADVEAYRLYLLGRHHWNNRYSVGLSRGLDFFRRALEIDPDYALAHAGVADSYTVMAFYDLVDADEAYEKARAAVGRALELGPELAEPRMSNGLLRMWLENDWAGAEEALKQAAELAPGSALPWAWMCQLFAVLGRVEDLWEAADRARSLEPDNILTLTLSGNSFWLGRHPEEAIRRLAPVLERQPDFILAAYAMALAQASSGRFEEARLWSDRAVAASLRSPVILAVHAWVLFEGGHVEEAEAAVDELGRRAGEERVEQSLTLAEAAVGRHDRYFTRLPAYAESRFAGLFMMSTNEMVDGVRDDPRFRDLLERLGLPVLDFEDMRRRSSAIARQRGLE